MIPKIRNALFLLTIFSASAYAYFLNEEECLNYTIYPVQYDLTLIPYIDGEHSYYDCDMVITVIANAPNLRVIELDAKDLEIKRESVKVYYNNNRNIVNDFRPYEYDNRIGKVHLYLTEDLEQYSLRKTQYFIKMSFRKYLKKEESGVFIVKYEDLGKQKYLLTTRLSPNKAKSFFPCFEHPQYEAVLKFKVYQMPPRVESYHNTSLVIAKEMKRTYHKDYAILEYMPSPQVAAYQTGFHYSCFSSQQATATRTNDTILLWAPTSTLHQYKYILDYSTQIMDSIQDYSQVSRSIVNGPMNFIAVPALIDTYEVGSWNLMSIGDHQLMYSSQYTSSKQKELMSYLLTQHLCRIWLGNPGEEERTRWRQEWFKEGMATYLGYYFMSQVKDFDDMHTYGLHLRNRAMTLDWRHDTPSLASFDKTLAVDIPSRYKNLVETKTAALLWMIESWIGSERFHAALMKYINTRRGKFVSVEDFVDFIQTETLDCEFVKGFTTADVIRSWFSQPGFPVVKVTVYRNERAQEVVHLEQKQFAFNNNTRSHHKYLVPISYITQHTKDCFNCAQPKFTIHDTGYSFKETLNGGWIVLNRNATGYYRVNYDVDTWLMIVATMKGPERNKIGSLNRAQIINDAFALYMSGDIDLDLATEIVSCLEFEDDAVVWDAAIDGFETLKTDGATVEMTKMLYNEWKSLLRNVISSVYRRVTSNFDRDHQSRLFRSRVVTFACSIGHALCLRDLEPALQQIRRESTYDPDVREICYYVMLNSTYDQVRENNRFEKQDLIAADHMMREEERFLYKLPIGRPRPMHLKQARTTTTSAPLAITRKEHNNEGHNSTASSTQTTLILSALIVFKVTLTSVMLLT